MCCKNEKIVELNSMAFLVIKVLQKSPGIRLVAARASSCVRHHEQRSVCWIVLMNTTDTPLPRYQMLPQTSVAVATQLKVPYRNDPYS